MKTAAFLIFLTGGLCVNSLAQDTLPKRVTPPVKYTSKPISRVERAPFDSTAKINIFGDYVITGYAILSNKTPSREELDLLIGTAVKVQPTSITGTNIDLMTFEIYQVERQNREDYLYRVFGSETKQTDSLTIPESFNVHKTDNENCYGIIEVSANEIAIPYKGVLLYLRKS